MQFLYYCFPTTVGWPCRDRTLLVRLSEGLDDVSLYSLLEMLLVLFCNPSSFTLLDGFDVVQHFFIPLYLGETLAALRISLLSPIQEVRVRL